jgi:hypothetical protein
MEQRNDRIDRKLQREDVVRCHYFVFTQRPEVLGTRGRQEAEAMRRVIEDQRKRILARKEDVKRNEAQLTLGFDKMELLQLEEERKDWDKRLTAIGSEVEEEPARILKSYEVQAHRVEPIGVVYLWPISG